MIENKFKVIDAHCHIYPEKIVDKAVAGTDAFYSTKAACRGTAEELIEIGAKAGIASVAAFRANTGLVLGFGLDHISFAMRTTAAHNYRLLRWNNLFYHR